MKTLLLSCAFLLLFTTNLLAQAEYQLYQDGNIVMLGGPDGNDLSYSIVTDTVILDNSEITYRFRSIARMDLTMEYPYGGFVGPSIWGSRLRVASEGASYFTNKQQKDILLRQRAANQESWEAYRFSDSLYLEAKVSSVSWAPVFETMDSVKIIEFQARRFESQEAVEHPANSVVLKISKQYGLLQSPDFYSFPEADHFETFYVNGMTQPQMGLPAMDGFSIFNFEPGDEMQTFFYYPCYPYSCNLSSETKFLEKWTDANDGNIYYKISQCHASHQSGSPVYTTANFDTISYAGYGASAYLATIPGQLYDYFGEKRDGARVKLDNNGGIPFKVFYPLLTCGDSLCTIFQSTWQIPIFYEEYANGGAGPYVPWGSAGSKQLLYLSKENATYGAPNQLGGNCDSLLAAITAIDEPKDSFYAVYPNPANSFVTVDFPDEDINTTHQIELLDLLGRQVYSSMTTASETTIPLDGMETGIYLLSIYREGHRKVVRKLLIRN